MIPRIVRALATLALPLVLAACAQPPGTTAADRPATSAARGSGDARTGAEARAQILAQFGGEYDDPELAAYVNRIGRRIAAVSEQPDAPWTFTVLDTPTVNAFATPGGYVYVTRGLVALAESEAELAGVIGHEIGHVTAGHSGLRRDRATVAGLGLLLGSIGLAAAGVDPQLAGGLMQTAAGGVLADYSRADELAADNLGIRYLARAGYDPLAQADFLDRMGRASALNARLAGQRYDPNRVDFFSTHPATAERTRRAIALADSVAVQEAVGTDRERDAFLAVLDGVTYGDNPDQGLVDGRRFVHPALRFAYEVPPGFAIQNRTNAVVAGNGEGARLILEASRDPGGSLEAFIARQWVPQIAQETRTGRLQGPEPRRINGLEAAEAILPVEVQGRRLDALLVAIRHRGAIYRLTGLAQPGSGALQAMRAAAGSFRPLSEAEARAIKPKRIEIRTVRQGDTVASLARLMATDAPEERFRLLNGLDAGEPLQPGRRVKIVR